MRHRCADTVRKPAPAPQTDAVAMAPESHGDPSLRPQTKAEEGTMRWRWWRPEPVDPDHGRDPLGRLIDGDTVRPPRPRLRPDLHGVVLELNHGDTLALLPEETATLVVETVTATGDPDWVEVAGAWSGPDGDDVYARVEVRASALPKPEAVR